MPDRRYHHGDLRAALLKRAEQALREQGVDALSLRELAREIGVSHAAPSRHFADKRALLDALALTGFERLTSVLQRANVTGDEFQDRLAALGRAYVDFAISNAALLELMYASKHDPQVSDQLTAAADRMWSGLLGSIADAQAAGEIVTGDPMGVALAVATTLHGFATFIANGSVDKGTVGETLAVILHHLLHGLAPRR